MGLSRMPMVRNRRVTTAPKMRSRSRMRCAEPHSRGCAQHHDHVAVMRPHAWLMLGHCAGLRNTQKLGDYVLAHGYGREDHVLDEELPLWAPIPALAEMQVALEQAVAEVTGMTGFELKRVMRTGTVASVDNRNWELADRHGA